MAEAREPGELGVLVLEITIQAESASADRTEARADAGKLVDFSKAAGHHLALGCLVRIGARRREAERAGLHRLRGQPAHLGDVLSGGRFAPDRAVTHHIDAQRMVRDLRRDIDRARHAFERVEKIGKALPIPLEAFGQYRAGDVLDPFHQIDQRVTVVRPDRRKADAAIAEQDRRHAVP